MNGPLPAPAAAKKRRLWIPLSTVLIALAVVVSAYALGIWPFSHSSGCQGTNATTYSQAESLAVSCADGEGGGPWSAMYAIGLATPVAAHVPRQWLYPFAACSGTASPGVSPGETELLSPGNSTSPGVNIPFGTVDLLNPGGSFRSFLVAGPSTSLIYRVDGNATCQPFGPPPAVDPTVVDSPKAVSAAGAAGGSAFVAAHPNSALTLILTGIGAAGQNDQGPSDWIVRWSTCLPAFLEESKESASGDAVVFYVNATAGSVFQQLGSGPISCSSAPTAASVSPPLHGGAPQRAGSPTGVASGTREGPS